jgi:hypothetical protein
MKLQTLTNTAAHVSQHDERPDVTNLLERGITPHEQAAATAWRKACEEEDQYQVERRARDL